MKRVSLILAASVAVTATAVLAAPPGPMGPPPGPPPPYQLRPVEPAGDRTKPGGDGRTLFEVHCGYCHLNGGMGTNLLTKQRLMVGETPDKGLLANRTDLTADYVKAVVRMGKGAMPAQTRVDLTDAELDAVSKYLGKAG
ncbi:c-type cytochrome [Novosphingobium cyanobacteriorum]|uniref:Cytochrome c n=1 Tax=Novosphingobium cyanobacteriorum TaxID=3024215 RepID=A0ABT6CKN7_9SPHN|nr:cytochrome c [Novosphingobium cyanobacteriorum]MDF8334495.1 cytochrome c [Novosphingobium cyanobacteriorum]